MTINEIRKDLDNKRIVFYADEVKYLLQEFDYVLEALKLADGALSGANMNMKVVEMRVRTALAKGEM
jgi:hypothetical protein